MFCKHAEPLLNALVDGELSPLTAWRVRIHLRRCPACAQEYAGIQQVDDLVCTWREATTVPAPDTLHAYACSLRPVVETTASNVAKEQNKMVRFVPVVVTTILFIGGAFLAKKYVPNLPTGVAFAEVEAALDEVQTLHCVTRGEWKGVIIQKSKARTEVEREYSEMWVQANPPAFAIAASEAGTKYSTHGFRVPGAKGVYATIEPHSRIIGDKNGVVKYVRGKPSKQISSEPVTGAAIQKTMFNNLLKHFRTGRATTVRDAKGRPLLCFLGIKEEHETVKNRAVHFKARTTLLADPATRLPVQFKMEWYGDADSSWLPHSRHELVMDFYYNQTPPAGAFTPPTGKPAVKTK